VDIETRKKFYIALAIVGGIVVLWALYPYNDTLIILISASSGARGKHGDSSVVST